MSVGFGCSVGDFISALELVTTVVNALRESSDSSAEYQALIKQLYTLSSALIRVKQLELGDIQHAEVVALRQAASQCQNTIDAFWEKIEKYQPSLRAGGSWNRLRDGWRKVKWALCKKEDVVRFKAALMAHTVSIDMLLTTIHMRATRIEAKKNENNRTLVGKAQESYFECMQRMLEQVSSGIQQGKQLLEMTAKIIQTNVQIFQVVLSLHDIVTRIPRQIDCQQPVYLIDAIGRHQLFHLEFIRSAELVKAFVAVLEDNFNNIGSGTRRIKRGEFAIQDSVTKRDVNLSLPWESCFCPGQRVDMSMVFNSSGPSEIGCPKCHEVNDDESAEGQDVECRNYKMIYRRSNSWDRRQARLAPIFEPEPEPEPQYSIPLGDSHSPREKRKGEDQDEEMSLFRRVRLKASFPSPSESEKAMEKRFAMSSHFRTNMLSLCVPLTGVPPTDPKKKVFKDNKLNQTIMGQVLLKIDALKTQGNDSAGEKRREFVGDMQAVLDSIMHKMS